MKRISKRTWVALALVGSCFVGFMSFANNTAEFEDVPANYWAYSGIQYVVGKGLFNGTSETTFSPETQMTRGQLATVLYRYAGSPVVSASADGYTDVTTDMYCYDAVRWCKLNKIFDDSRRDYFKIYPNSGIGRGEFAEMLFRFAKAQGKATDITYADRSSMEDPFTDMDPVTRDVRDAMVFWAYKNGILSGTSATTMSPGDPIKRAHVAVMLSRYDEKFGSGTNNSSESTNQSNLKEDTIWNDDSSVATPNKNAELDSDLNANMELRLESIRLTNEIRKENGVGELIVDEGQMNAAQEIAKGYAEKDFVIDHDDNLEYKMKQRYGCHLGGTNLAMTKKVNTDDKSFAYELVNSLKNSPGHFRTMVDSDLYSIGVGAYKRESDGKWFYVQSFGVNPATDTVSYYYYEN